MIIDDNISLVGLTFLSSMFQISSTMECHGLEDVVLGNAVISKKFLRTHKIMVMHSNERGECDVRTLVDQQQKH